MRRFLLLTLFQESVVGIECNGATFLSSFKEGPHQNCSFTDTFQNSASKMVNCILVDIFNCLNCYYWQLTNS